MNALDDLRNTPDTLDAGARERLHDRWIHSCTAGYRDRYGVDQNHSGAKTFLTCPDTWDATHSQHAWVTFINLAIG